MTKLYKEQQLLEPGRGIHDQWFTIAIKDLLLVSTAGKANSKKYVHSQ